MNAPSGGAYNKKNAPQPGRFFFDSRLARQLANDNVDQVENVAGVAPLITTPGSYLILNM
jgi:hypothetical protein